MRWWIDVLGVVLVAVNLVLGLRYGTMRRVIGLAGLFAGVGLASLTADDFARFFRGSGEPGDLYADAWAFIAVAATVTITVEVVGALFDEKLRRVISLVFDRTAGMVTGVLVGLLEISVVCLVGLAVGHAIPPDNRTVLPEDRVDVSNAVGASVIGGRVSTLEAGLLNIFRPVLPRDLPAHLANSAQKQ